MGFYVTKYSIDRSLPDEFIWRDLEMINPTEVTPGIYKREETIHYDECNSLLDLKEKLESSELFKESDIAEWQLDEKVMKNPSAEMAELLATQSNFFIMKLWGLDIIALDAEQVFVEMSIKELADMIRSL